MPGTGLDSQFLFYYFMLRSERDILKLCNARGDGQSHRNGYHKEARSSLPPLPEQRRIVAILDEAFAGLEAMRANAEKNLQNARDLFDSYLDSIFIHKQRRMDD